MSEEHPTRMDLLNALNSVMYHYEVISEHRPLTEEEQEDYDQTREDYGKLYTELLIDGVIRRLAQSYDDVPF